MDIQSLAKRQGKRHQPARGSLPLKKRITSYSLPTASPHIMQYHRNKATVSEPGSDETLAALALIQASSGTVDASVSQYQSQSLAPDLPLLPHMERENDARQSLLSLHRRAFVHNSSAPTSTLFVSNIYGSNPIQQCATEDTIEVSTSASDITMGTRSTASFSSSEEKDSRRSLNHRSNAISRGPHPDEGLQLLGQQQQTHSDSTAPTSSSAYSPQDKRYTGLPYDVRCKATTTRGRACAYVAANGTDYCNLHAAHQGKCVLMKQQQQLLAPQSYGARKKTTAQELRVDPPGAAMAAPADVSAKLPSPLVHVTLDKKPRGRRACKLAEKHATSPYFLLSMIPSDQWRGKHVSILTGPMKDEEGIVEKWSNGWVSVRIPKIGVHNRRSIELAIVKTAECSKVPSERDETRLSFVCRPVVRDTANPSPFSDIDLSLATPGMDYNHSCSGSNNIETPRTIVINVYRETETPATNEDFIPIPSVTPGSTHRAFHRPFVASQDKAITFSPASFGESQTPISDIVVFKAGNKRIEASTSLS